MGKQEKPLEMLRTTGRYLIECYKMYCHYYNGVFQILLLNSFSSPVSCYEKFTQYLDVNSAALLWVSYRIKRRRHFGEVSQSVLTLQEVKSL